MGIPISTGAAWMVDPHLMVLGVLVAGWVLDKLLATLEWLRGPGPNGAADRPGAPVETGGPADVQTGSPMDARTDGHAGGGSRSAGAE